MCIPKKTNILQLNIQYGTNIIKFVYVSKTLQKTELGYTIAHDKF